jgi:hypothetical protein
MRLQSKGKDRGTTAQVERRDALACPAFARRCALVVRHVASVPALAVLALAPVAGEATMYKWVDEKGVVHYSDKVPPDAVNKNRIELNEQGVQVKKTDKPLTSEQIRAKEQEEARNRQVDKQQEEVARRDRALVSSYTTEKDIDLAKHRALQTIEAQIQSAEAYGAQLKLRSTDAETKKAGYAGKPVPVALERELDSIASESARNAEFIARKKKEAEAAKAKYEADKLRWRELVAAKSAEAQSVAVPAPAAATPVAAKPTGAAPPASPGKK